MNASWLVIKATPAEPLLGCIPPNAVKVSNELSRQALEAANRAWVIPMWNTVDTRFATEGWGLARMHVKNWGGGVAKEVWGWGRLVTSPSISQQPSRPDQPPGVALG